MPELKAGLLWRMDARKPEQVFGELHNALMRFVGRTGQQPRFAHAGYAADSLIVEAHRRGLLAELPGRVTFLATSVFPLYDILVTGDEPQEAEPCQN